MKHFSEHAPLDIGTKVPHYGEVGAIVLTGGERYYMLLDRKTQVVSFMPYFAVEPWWQEEAKKRG